MIFEGKPVKTQRRVARSGAFGKEATGVASLEKTQALQMPHLSTRLHLNCLTRDAKDCPYRLRTLFQHAASKSGDKGWNYTDQMRGS